MTAEFQFHRLTLIARRVPTCVAVARIPALLLSSFVIPSLIYAQPGTIIDLGTLPGDSTSAATGINASGQVVGESGPSLGANPGHAFLYSGGSMTDLGTLPGGTGATASGINDAGQVVGAANLPGTYHAFLYSGGSMTDLSTLFPGTSSVAYGINAAVQISVTAGEGVGQNVTTAFLYSGGSLTDLGTLGGISSTAFGINASGQVVGWAETIGNVEHAFLYSDGSMTDLGTLPGGSYSTAFGINAVGQVVGDGYVGNAYYHAFLYSGGSMTDLGTLGGSFSLASSINASGQVVGESGTGGNVDYHAFLYSNGTMIDLNSLLPTGSGWVLNAATAINDPGQIVGYGTINGQTHAFLFWPVLTPALQFYPVAPCRLVDTRVGQGKTGAFGPPALAAFSDRNFALLSGGCSIPSTAQAYSLNFTVVPSGPLGFLSAWPTGEAYPGVSTLNSIDGSVIANAAIVPAGTSGSITVVAGNPTDLIIDVNGYFAPATASGLDFFPLTPCRIADTRSTQSFTGAFGPPSLAGFVTRDFPLATSPCLSGSEQAYSLNVTVVPPGPLGFLSIWPAGQPYPGVSTLNSPDGTTLANAAIVPAGTGGDVNVVAGNPTDVIIDINGKFAAPRTGLQFYAVTPCRVADTRTGQNFTGAFGPPSLAAFAGRNFPIQSSPCGIPAAAQAYALNMTVVPQGPLGFLSAWPTGDAYPGVSTLNSPDGFVIANAAIVPAGSGGAITVVAGNPTDLIIDIVGYFAP